MTINRRSFLAGSTATIAAGLSGAANAASSTKSESKAPKSAPEVEFVNAPADLGDTGTFDLGKSMIDESEVITANHWGLAKVKVRGGKITSISPFEFDPAPTPNLDGIKSLPYSEARIRRPMVRAGFLKNGPASREARGDEEFVEVSWDEALDLAAKEINRIYDEYGPSAVFGRSYGWMSTGRVNSSISLLHRLLNFRGGFIGCENSYSTAAISKILPYVVGTGDPKTTVWDVIVKNSERVVFWGADPLVTNDIDWSPTLHNSIEYIKALKAKGTKTYSINPVGTDTAAFLGSEWIQARPGTDTAMMLGMIHHLVAQGKADVKFLEKYTTGHKEFLDYVAGKEDGVEKTPEWAESKCGVPAEQIKKLALDLASHRTMLIMGWGPQRAQYGEQPHWMLVALAAVLGQIGLPGGGFGTNYHYSNGGCPAKVGPFVPGIPTQVEPLFRNKKPWVGSTVIPVARFVDALLNPGQTIDFNGRKVVYPNIKLIMWAGGNPFAHQPDTNKLRRAWKKAETVIVSDTVWTATARHADIVFPACTSLETVDIAGMGTYTNDGIVMMEQAIEPQWDSKSDFEIFSMLADKMGYKEEFTEGLTQLEWVKAVYENSRRFGARLGYKLPEFDEFRKKGYILYPVSEKERQFVSFSEFRKDPKGSPLSTESGKIVLFSKKIASYGYKDCLGHPAYFEPSEGVNTATKEAPLAVVACKSRYRLHSQLNSTCRETSDISEREPIWINPKDAEARGLNNGDVVEVFNKRGSLLAGVIITDRAMPGVVVVHHGAWYDPQVVDGRLVDVHGNSNTVVLDEPTSSLASGNIASTALVEVKKFEGELPEVKVFKQPA